MKKASIFLIHLLLLAQVALGQRYQYYAGLPTVEATGFYKIQLTPAVTAHTLLTFNDVRLLDQKNREVPYILEREQPVQTRKLFREYEVIQKTLVPRVGTTLVLRNPNKTSINNISLIIKNANVRKKARLSGSPDNVNWFGIEDQFQLEAINNTAATSEVKLLDFPLSDYTYYKLEINDSASAPLNILSAGYYDMRAENGKYSLVPNITYRQADSLKLKKSFLWFSAPYPVMLDKLVFTIAAPTYYYRNATLYQRMVSTGKRGKKTVHDEPVTSLILQSNTENTVTLSDFQAREFYLQIENADNPPLEFKAVQGYQLNSYLTAELKANKPYQLQFGNSQAAAPTYDLPYFTDKIPANVAVLVPTEVWKAGTKPAAGNPNPLNALFTTNYLIWGAIIVVIGLLGFMSFQMLKDTEGNKG